MQLLLVKNLAGALQVQLLKNAWVSSLMSTVLCELENKEVDSIMLQVDFE